jgi:acyl-CoA synthetase (AMP-forming)/AMP-acid ligase II
MSVDSNNIVSDLRIGDLLARNVAARPAALAVIEPDGVSRTWAELDVDTAQLAGGLGSLGLTRHDRLATIVRNGAGAVEALFAAARGGFVGIPINYGLTPAEVGVIFKDSEPKAILVDDDFVDLFREQIDASGAIVIVRGATGARPAVWHDYARIKHNGGPFDEAAVSPDDIRTIRYTSGTTAAPKGCLGTHRQILSSIANFFGELDVPDAPFLQLLPLFSGAGIWMVFAAAYHGVASVVPDAFKPDEALQSIAAHGVGHACGVPTMLSRLCEEYDPARYDVSSLKLFGYTGSPMPPAVIRKALGLLPWNFYQGFGGGEMGGLVSYLKPEDHPRSGSADDGLAERLRTAGRPAKYAELVMRSLTDGSPLPLGEAGEISVRSSSNFAGYHNRPEETAHTLRGEWVYTGDVGFIDEEGLLHVIDRVKDMVITGGMNVSSAEVEAAIMDHPAVQSAAVFGVPDNEWGEVVTAAVILRDGHRPSEADLVAFARQHLAGYKSPKAIHFLESFPMNSAGKILKRELRKRFASIEV